jgi:hypothetical protein
MFLQLGVRANAEVTEATQLLKFVEIALEVRIGDLGNCAIQVSYGLEPL